MSNRQSTVGFCRANIDDQSRACETRLCLFLYPCIGVDLCTDMCVCVFSSHSFWTSIDVPAGISQEEGHTGFLIHLLYAVHALIFLARRIQLFLSREVEFGVLTILIVLHPLGIFILFFSFLVRKIPFAGIELMSQRVRGLRGTSELPGRPADIRTWYWLKYTLYCFVLLIKISELYIISKSHGTCTKNRLCLSFPTIADYVLLLLLLYRHQCSRGNYRRSKSGVRNEAVLVFVPLHRSRPLYWYTYWL